MFQNKFVQLLLPFKNFTSYLDIDLWFLETFVCTLLFTDEPCPPGKEFKECVCPEYIYPNSTCVEEDWNQGGKEKCELDPVEGCYCPPGTKEEEDGSCVPCGKLSKYFCPRNVAGLNQEMMSISMHIM